jgi:PAS domain S-box-containing protein
MDDLLNTAPCGFLSFNDDGRILMVNATLLDSLGYESGELQGRQIESILPVASRIFYQTYFFPLLKLNGKVEEIYLSLRTKSGADVPVLTNAVRRVREESIVNDCIVVQIRQRNQYEDEILRAKKVAEEATRAKDEFLAVVSHELRTPLTAILGWAGMMRAGNLDDAAVKSALEAIERNARSQAQIIEDILDFSRIISGNLRLDVQQIEPADMIDAALEVVRPAADAKGIQMQSVRDPGDCSVSGDPNRLQQVMWNLLSNAIKFTPRGGRVQVGLERIDSHIEISVSDTGQGISAEFLPYVFERFQQADSTMTRRHGGLGLAWQLHATSSSCMEERCGPIAPEKARGLRSRWHCL